jgi:hypothetical protein
MTTKRSEFWETVNTLRFSVVENKITAYPLEYFVSYVAMLLATLSTLLAMSLITRRIKCH